MSDLIIMAISYLLIFLYRFNQNNHLFNLQIDV